MLFITGGVTSHRACAPGGPEMKLKMLLNKGTGRAGGGGYPDTARRLLPFFTETADTSRSPPRHHGL